MSRHSKTPGRGTFRLLVLAVVLLLGLSVVLLRVGLHHTSPAAAPLPPRTFDIAVLPAPAPSRASGSDTHTALPERSSVPAAPRTLPKHLLAAHLYIPSLGVAAPYQPITPSADTLIPPFWPQEVGLDTRGGQVDGRSGTVLMTSHVNYAGRGNGAFADLYAIAPLAEVVVTDSSDAATYWQVTRLADPLKSDGIDQSIFDATGPRRLVLATCGGAVHGGDYDRNILAYALPVRTA